MAVTVIVKASPRFLYQTEFLGSANVIGLFKLAPSSVCCHGNENLGIQTCVVRKFFKINFLAYFVFVQCRVTISIFELKMLMVPVCTVYWLLSSRQTLGVIRVPLHTLVDGDRGFPMFLAGKFVGNAKKQLISTILQKNLMSMEDVARAVERSKHLMT